MWSCRMLFSGIWCRIASYIFFLRRKEKLPTYQNTQRQISHNSSPYSTLILCIPNEEDVTYSFTLSCANSSRCHCVLCYEMWQHIFGLVVEWDEMVQLESRIRTRRNRERMVFCLWVFSVVTLDDNAGERNVFANGEGERMWYFAFTPQSWHVNYSYCY